jgi:energy-coupling factor transport system permease protein
MTVKYDNYHILTTISLCLILLIILLSTDNPLLITGVIIFCLFLLISSGSIDKFRRGLMYFIPYSIVVIVINFIFVAEGSTVLFSIMGKAFTLEALIYALIFAVKLLGVIYIFMLLDIMVDSDKAVSYFSAVMPKSTFMLMIAFKLFPSVRKRMKSLRETYSMRGVEFDNGSYKKRLLNYMPVLSVLMESSLEGAFDIGEAAYVRGFLSTKRTIYDKQYFVWKDYSVLTSFMILLITFIIVKVLRYDTFNVYGKLRFAEFLNGGTAAVLCTLTAVILNLFFTSRYNRNKGDTDELY